MIRNRSLLPARPGREHVPRNDTRGPADLYRFVGVAQALYYVVTGVWPLISIRTFEKISGPKFDDWLVKTVGVLVTVIGITIGLAAKRRSTEPEIPVVAIGSAAGLAAIDIVYVARRRISPIYLLDAVAEIALIAAWIAAWRRARP